MKNCEKRKKKNQKRISWRIAKTSYKRYCKDKLQTVLQIQVTNGIANTSYKQTHKIYKCGVHMKQTKTEGQAYIITIWKAAMMLFGVKQNLTLLKEYIVTANFCAHDKTKQKGLNKVIMK